MGRPTTCNYINIDGTLCGNPLTPASTRCAAKHPVKTMVIPPNPTDPIFWVDSNGTVLEEDIMKENETEDTEIKTKEHPANIPNLILDPIVDDANLNIAMVAWIEDVNAARSQWYGDWEKVEFPDGDSSLKDIGVDGHKTLSYFIEYLERYKVWADPENTQAEEAKKMGTTKTAPPSNIPQEWTEWRHSVINFLKDFFSDMFKSRNKSSKNNSPEWANEVFGDLGISYDTHVSDAVRKIGDYRYNFKSKIGN